VEVASCKPSDALVRLLFCFIIVIFLGFHYDILFPSVSALTLGWASEHLSCKKNLVHHFPQVSNIYHGRSAG